MRKSTKLAILVAALVALCSIAALAADTWKQEGDQWFCYDKDNNPYYGAWKKSGSNWYYLDDATGAMVTNKLVETDGEKYWCGEDGARVLQKWVQVPVENDGDGFEWMFFKALTGKAVKGDGTGSFISVKNAEGVTRKYLFDTDGYMLYGYLQTATGTKADSVVDANYYMGPKDEGWQRTEWQKFVDGELGGEYEESSLVYFYFKNSVKQKADYNKQYAKVKVATGKYYYFGKDGHLFTGYQFLSTDSNGKGVATSAYFLGEADDGLMKKKVWVKTAAIEGTGDSSYWYYLGADGHPYAAAAGTTAQIKKINGKFYLISEKGRMITGLATVVNEDELDPTEAASTVKTGYKSVSEFTGDVVNPAANERIYYFSTDADNDGSMKTGVQTVVIDDSEVTVYLDKHGVAYEGVVSNKIYNNGVLQAAGDAKYAVAGINNKAAEADPDYYLVNAAGAILKNTKVMDADGIWWVVEDDYEIFKFADREYSATAASNWKQGKTYFQIGNTYYDMRPDASKSVEGKFTYITWEKR